MKRSSGSEKQRFILEELEAGGNRIRKVPGIAELGVVLRAGLVMANSREVPQDLAGGDGSIFRGKGRTILLDRRIQIKLAVLPEQHGCGGSNGFGDRGQTVESMRSGRDKVFQVRHAETCRPVEFAIFNHSD